MMTVAEKSEKKFAVQKDVEDLVAASQRYMQHSDDDGEAKLDLQRKASNLTQTLRDPIPSALSHFEDVSIQLNCSCVFIY